MMVDDLWLYQYHQQQYEGIIRDVFKTIAFIESKQWEVVGIKEYLDELKDQIEDIPKYNVHSNQKYMDETRNNNFLLDVLLDFVVVSIPLTLAM